MAKDTYYFSHDYDPTGDPKMAAMIGEYGAIGYGIFWRIVEMLHSDKDHKLPIKKYIFQAIAKQLLNTCKQNLLIEDLPQYVESFINECINTYELFVINDGSFSSNRVFRHFEKKQKISDLRSEIGKKGAIAKQNNILPFAEKQNEAKESKVKESIINNNSDFVCLDVERFILGNQQVFEKICIATSKGVDLAKKELRQYHLWLEKKGKYPTNNKAVIAGFESWLLNGENYKTKYNLHENANGIIQDKIPANLKKLN